MKTLIFRMVALLALLMPGATFAQYATAIVTLDGESGTESTFTALCSARKGKEAMADALEGTFNALFTQGVEGVHSGQPMLNGDNRTFLYRFFNEHLYNRFLSGKPVKVSEQKVNGEKQVTIRVSIRLQALLREARNSGASINPAWADKKQQSATSGINPTVIVVPYVKGTGDDGFAAMKGVMDTSPAYSLAVSEMSGIFSREGYKTRDLRTALKNSRNSQILNEDAQNDNRSNLLRQLPGDIVVTLEIVPAISGNRGAVTVNATAVENQTENTLASVSYASGQYLTTDTVALVRHALGKVEGQFFADVRQAFRNMVDNGRAMALEFNLGSTVSDWDFDLPSPATDDDFKAALEEWLADNAFGGVYDMGTSSDKFIQASINIPVWDTERNRAYSTSRFNGALRKFLRDQLGEEYKPTVTAMSQKLHITIE